VVLEVARILELAEMAKQRSDVLSVIVSQGTESYLEQLMSSQDRRGFLRKFVVRCRAVVQGTDSTTEGENLLDKAASQRVSQNAKELDSFVSNPANAAFLDAVAHRLFEDTLPTASVTSGTKIKEGAPGCSLHATDACQLMIALPRMYRE
jgi:hypothetical protein